MRRGHGAVSYTHLLPDGLKKIDQWAFCSTKLKEIIIPDSVETIGFNAFIYLSLIHISYSTCTMPSAF